MPSPLRHALTTLALLATPLASAMTEIKETGSETHAVWR